MAALTTDQILEAISSMTVLEVSELVKAMEEKFGVSAAAPVAVAAVAGPPLVPLLPKSRPSSTLPSSPLRMRRRSPLSRKFEPLPVWASRKPRISLKALPSPSRKVFPRTKPTRSRNPSPPPVVSSRLPDLLVPVSQPEHDFFAATSGLCTA